MPEQQNIEWKESWRDEYLKWICGFANASGGKLYIGCDDSGKVVGVSDSKKLMEDIPNKIRDAMGIVVDVNRLTEGDREYIEIDVPPYPIGISCKGVYDSLFLEFRIPLFYRQYKAGHYRTGVGSFPDAKAWRNMGSFTSSCFQG